MSVLYQSEDELHYLFSSFICMICDFHCVLYKELQLQIELLLSSREKEKKDPGRMQGILFIMDKLLIYTQIKYHSGH